MQDRALAPAAVDQRRPVRNRLRYPRLGADRLAFANHWPHIGTRISRIAHAQSGDGLYEPLPERALDAALDEEPLRRGADLPGAPERRRGASCRGAIQIRVVAHD